MARIARRRLLQLSGAGVMAGGIGGIAGILAAGHAPAARDENAGLPVRTLTVREMFTEADRGAQLPEK